MTIPLLCKNTGYSLLIRRCTDSYANATIQILGDLITKEIYFEGCNLVYRYLLGAEAAFLENASVYQYARSQLGENEKISALRNLATEVKNKINNLVSLIAENLQPALYEVFHVRS